MKVGTIKAMLDGYDDDAEVYLATQPNWPLAAEIANVTSLDDMNLSDDQLADEHHGDNPDVVWIVAAGGSLYPDPYAPRAVFQL